MQHKNIFSLRRKDFNLYKKNLRKWKIASLWWITELRSLHSVNKKIGGCHSKKDSESEEKLLS